VFFLATGFVHNTIFKNIGDLLITPEREMKKCAEFDLPDWGPRL
jgi:hypothetical protein